MKARKFTLAGLILNTILLQIHCQEEKEEITQNELNELVDIFPELKKMLQDMTVDYESYLYKIISTMKWDSNLISYMGSMGNDDAWSGEFAETLKHGNLYVRSLLDQAKLNEIERLETFCKAKYDAYKPELFRHLDMTNRRTFGIKDLRKVLFNVLKDRSEINAARHKVINEYRLKRIETEGKTPAKPKAAFWDKPAKPSKKEDENIKISYLGHDYNNDGVLDVDEAVQLSQSVLDEIYAKTQKGFDIGKKLDLIHEEMKRLFKEADFDKDNQLCYQEYMRHKALGELMTYPLKFLDSVWK